MEPSVATPPRWIAHVDLDAFYASCEQRDHPAYRGCPVVVGAMPGNRGVVAAASYEARAFGIHSAMPIAEAVRRCPDAVYLRPDMDKYQQASRQVFAILDEITPVVEKASIDEAYLDLSGLEKLAGPPDTIGRVIDARIVDQHIKFGVLFTHCLCKCLDIGHERQISHVAFNAPTTRQRRERLFRFFQL